jgi:hypothetical protein
MNAGGFIDGGFMGTQPVLRAAIDDATYTMQTEQRWISIYPLV